MTELPAGFTADAAELPEGFAVDTPKKKVGVLESMLRTAAQAAAPVVRTFDLAAAGLAGIAGAKGDQEKIFKEADQRQQRMSEEYAPAEGEEFSPTGEVLGGAASMPIAMLGQGVAPGINRAADVLQRGGTGGEATQAGAVTGVVNQALLMLPAFLGGKVAEKIGGGVARQAVGGAVTGAAVNVPAGALGKAAENAALPEGDQYKDLQQDPLATKDILVQAGLSAALGAAGAGGARAKATKAAAAKAAANPPLPADKMTDLGEGKYRTPNGVEITKDEWDGATKRVREGWLEEAPKEEKAAEAKVPDEIDRLREEHPTGPVADALKEVAAKREKAAKVKGDAAELRRAAEQTTDAEIKKTLNDRADKLDPRERIPVGEAIEGEPAAEKIPAGEAKEGQPEIKTEPAKKLPVGEAKELPEPYAGDKIPTGEAKEVTRSGAEPGVPVGEAKELYVPPEKRNAVEKDAAPKGQENTNEAAQEKPDAVLNDISFPKIEEGMIDAAQREAKRSAAPASTREGGKPLRVQGADERGAHQVRTALREGIRDGSVHKDGGALALWMLEKNPNAARGLELKASKSEGPGLGLYTHAQRTIELFKGQNVHTAPHEIFHHTERMLPEIAQAGIRREWKKALGKAIDDAKTPIEKQAMRDIMSSALRGDKAARGRVMQALSEGKLDKHKIYQLTNPSEFWAVNAPRILNDKFLSRGSWRAQAKQWMREMMEHVKSTVGLRSDSAVIKAVNDVLNPHKVRGERAGAKMLSEGGGRTPREVPRDFEDGRSLDVKTKPAKRELPEETKGELTERKLFDRFNRVLKQQEVQAPKSEKADIYGANREFQGRAQHRGDVLERDFVKPLGKKLEEAAKLKLTLEDAGDYRTALHADERNRAIAKVNPKLPDGGSGMTSGLVDPKNNQAKKVVESFTPEQRAKLDEIVKIVEAMDKHRLKGQLDDGLISQGLHDTLTNKYKHYAPLKSLEEEDAFTGIGQGYSIRANDIKEALGRTSKASNPITASLMDATRAIVRGEKARVGRSLWDYASNPEAHDFMRPYEELKPRGDVWVNDKGEVKQPPPEVLTQKKGPDGKVRKVIDPGKVDEHTIRAVINGEQKRVFVADAGLRDQIRNLASSNDPGAALAAVGRVTGAIGRTMTEYNPPFGAANGVKDAITIGVRAKAHGLDPAKVIAAIPEAWKVIGQYKLDPKAPDAALYREFLENGGKTGAYGITDFAHTQRKLHRLGAQLDQASKAPNAGAKAAAHTMRKIGEYLSNFNEFAEYGGRFAVYKEMRAKGETPRASIAAAKEITVNFNRSGEYGRALNSVLVFSNAALQGLRNFYVYAKHPAVQRGMLYIVATGAAGEAWNDLFGGIDEETGDPNALSQNDKVADKNVELFVPESRKGVKIPLPPEYAFPFTLGRRFYRGLAHGQWAREAGGIVSGAIDAVAPVRLPGTDSGVGSVMKSVSLTATKPFTELLGDNKDYTGADIVPDRHDKSSPAPYYKTARRTTSEIAKAVSKFANDWTGGDEIKPGLSEATLGPLISPEGIEHIVGYYTGGIGQTAMQSVNLTKGATKGEEVDVNKIPFANRFVFDEPKSYTSRRYQELKSDIEYADSYEKAGKPDKADPKALRALGEFKSAQPQLTVLFKRLKTAEGDEKTGIEKEIKATQSRVIKAYNGQPTP